MGSTKNLKVFSGSSQYWLSFLTLFSFALGAANVPMMILTFILLIATFGVGFSVKKYRKTIGFKIYLSLY